MNTPENITFIRITTFSSTRHYGGRDIKQVQHICKANFIKDQRDNTKLCKLIEDCAGYKANHLLAVQPIDFNVVNPSITI